MQTRQSDYGAIQSPSKKPSIRPTFVEYSRVPRPYALDHIKGMGPPPDENALKRVREAMKQLPKETTDIVADILQRYEMSLLVVGISREVIAEFDHTLNLIPASEWTRKLQSMPTGAILPGRKILFSYQGDQRQYYDVTEGRFLSAAEAEHARSMSAFSSFTPLARSPRIRREVRIPHVQTRKGVSS